MAGNVLTHEARVSYPYVFEPNKGPNNDQEPKYSLTLLFAKGADLAPLKKAAEEAVREKWGDKPPKKLKSPFLDQGDYDKPGYEAGCIMVRASSNERPGLVDARVQPIIDPCDFYAGCYCRATLRAFAYDRNGNQGVSFGLQNIQKLRDGERLAGRPKAEEDFQPVEGLEDGDMF